MLSMRRFGLSSSRPVRTGLCSSQSFKTTNVLVPTIALYEVHKILSRILAPTLVATQRQTAL
jgi:hypothetical protein